MVWLVKQLLQYVIAHQAAASCGDGYLARVRPAFFFGKLLGVHRRLHFGVGGTSESKCQGRALPWHCLAKTQMRFYILES